MSRDHYLPRLIIRNFTNSSGGICFLHKKDNKIYGPVDHYRQLQEKDFYSKKPLHELKELFPHIELNPIFQNKDLNLDENIRIYIETPAGIIFSKIIQFLSNGKEPKLSNSEIDLVKEYFIIQHLRTPRNKVISIEVNKTLKLPLNVGEIVMQKESQREIVPKDFINKYFSNLNHKQRREKLKLFNKQLKKNPKFIEEIRNSQEIKDLLDNKIKKSEEDLERIRTHPDKHSSEILDFKLRNIFSKRTDVNFDNRRLKFLVNNTKIPFVLSDTGIQMICWDYGTKKELHLYLPISPQILIEFSENSTNAELVNEDFIREFNQISKEESFINVYSNSKEALI